jgi:hypothetical protein
MGNSSWFRPKGSAWAMRSPSKNVQKQLQKVLQPTEVPMTLMGLNVNAMLRKGFPVRGVLLMAMILMCLPGLVPCSLDLVELFCGAGAISRAASRSGMSVKSMDIALCQFHDILSSAGFGQVSQFVAQAIQ